MSDFLKCRVELTSQQELAIWQPAWPTKSWCQLQNVAELHQRLLWAVNKRAPLEG